MRRAGGLAAALAASSLLAVGCGGGGDSADTPPAATAPAIAAAPVAVAPVGLGGTVAPGPTTPKRVAKALEGSGVVVVSFVVKGAADDDRVAAAIKEIRSDRATRKGVSFFNYKVGPGKPGDLADLLGVTGTPSVAVIGRDRTLINLWTGFVDADILRQSISDAKDTAAANPDAGKASATSSGTGATGDAKGIALAKKVNAKFAGLAGIKMSGSFPVAGVGTMEMNVAVAVDKGRTSGMAGTFTVDGASFEVAATRTSASIRSGAASCWATLPSSATTFGSTPQPSVSFTGARVGKPRSKGDSILLDVTAVGQKLTYVVDAKTFAVSEVRTSAGTMAFEGLESAPAISPGTPVCNDPKEALTGLPASFGGTGTG